jgi:hypothetical protein
VEGVLRLQSSMKEVSIERGGRFVLTSLWSILFIGLTAEMFSSDRGSHANIGVGAAMSLKENVEKSCVNG